MPIDRRRRLVGAHLLTGGYVTVDPNKHDVLVAGDAADHVVEARQRARKMLAGETHLGEVDDWRRALGSGRDALILIWLVWLALYGLGDPPISAAVLIATAVGVALLMGISTARSTYLQIQYYASELERERSEIRDHFQHECEEVAAIYAAKGFREPLLGQIVDTLSADEDRLLKVMMEEELGLTVYHMHHPLLVGMWNTAAALVMGLSLGLPLTMMSSSQAIRWMPGAGLVLMMILSGIAARVTRRSVVEFFVVGVVAATVTGGVVYFLAQWLAGVVGDPVLT